MKSNGHLSKRLMCNALAVSASQKVVIIAGTINGAFITFPWKHKLNAIKEK